jgi:hypothetical protein
MSEEIQNFISDLKEVNARLDYALECVKSLQFYLEKKDYQEALKIADLVDMWIRLALNRLDVVLRRV